ncbi:hypothetical protein NITLEN_50195 [Nitrospira lenta]|uniref:Uncharacterized protein n=1 Tax=Nitrospira lenta TaxID=1436998 RepID=A0A330L8A2_9BACT|nr:hypothetical protein NITLEN_50195 [Nitrospira lenta]
MNNLHAWQRMHHSILHFRKPARFSQPYLRIAFTEVLPGTEPRDLEAAVFNLLLTDLA